MKAKTKKKGETTNASLFFLCLNLPVAARAMITMIVARTTAPTTEMIEMVMVFQKPSFSLDWPTTRTDVMYWRMPAHL